MITFGLAALIFFALLIVLIIPMRLTGKTPPASELDIALGRRQLAEIEAERERGLISAEDAEAARAEIARRLLRIADRPSEGKPESRPVSGLGLAVLASLLLAGAGLVYLAIGRPDALRSVAAPKTVSPSQLAANGQTDPGEEALPPVDVLLDQLEARLEEVPDRLDGWLLLGRTALKAGDGRRAARAFAQARRLDPGNAELPALEGEALVLHAGGRVTPAADLAFAAALARDPDQPVALWYVGLGLLQNGREEEAAARWRRLLATTPEDAPWRETVAGRLFLLERQLAGESALPADAGAILALDGVARSEAIAQMVERLAERLAAEPDDIDGWIRLARSYRVLGDEAAAEAALRSARERAPADRLDEIDRLLDARTP
ncbi:MAG: c-type cytochrome biogenesis protein CcmI [Rhodothalassiaceae bacterium]